MPKLSPERIRTSKILRTHKDKAVEVLGVGYEVTLQERFDKTLIRLEIKLTPPPKKKRNFLEIKRVLHTIALSEADLLYSSLYAWHMSEILLF